LLKVNFTIEKILVKLSDFMNLKFKNPCEDDFLKLYDFVLDCPPLESYPEHFYKIILRYFPKTTVFLRNKNLIVGFVFGIPSQKDKDLIFLWQIGIDKNMRGSSVSKNLIKEFEKKVKENGFKKIELTIDPENIASKKFFEKNDYKNVSSKEKDTIRVFGNLAIKDFYKPGRHFMLYQKKLD